MLNVEIILTCYIFKLQDLLKCKKDLILNKLCLVIETSILKFQPGYRMMI
jgi:hypothetical protein